MNPEGGSLKELFAPVFRKVEQVLDNLENVKRLMLIACKISVRQETRDIINTYNEIENTFIIDGKCVSISISCTSWWHHVTLTCGDDKEEFSFYDTRIQEEDKAFPMRVFVYDLISHDPDIFME